MALAFLPAVTHGAEVSLNSVNLAGRQRMLGQRMVKAWIQQAHGVATEQSAVILADSIAQFERQLKQLAEAPADELNRRQLVDHSAQWRQLYPLLSNPPRRSEAELLNRQAEALLTSSEALVTGLQQAQRSEQARLVNLAGRQRMLSQRMAKAYMLNALLGSSATAQHEHTTAMREFASAHNQLVANPTNSPAIRQELEAVGVQWEWFKQALALDGPFAYTLVVADASESMLVALERAVALYAGQTP